MQHSVSSTRFPDWTKRRELAVFLLGSSDCVETVSWDRLNEDHRFFLFKLVPLLSLTCWPLVCFLKQQGCNSSKTRSWLWLWPKRSDSKQKVVWFQPWGMRSTYHIMPWGINWTPHFYSRWVCELEGQWVSACMVPLRKMFWAIIKTRATVLFLPFHHMHTMMSV